MRCHVAACLLAVALMSVLCTASKGGSFTIEDDQFKRDGKPFQIISGSMHYFRIHPAYWRDRLERAAAMGVNAVEVYTPWNMHEPYPGLYDWEGMADLEHWIQLIRDLDMLVVLRPGPYICAEWDFGGFPHWLASSKVAGGRTMRLRTNDPDYLAHVDRWWTVLLSKLRGLLYQNGGPIIMVQVENEYGFCGNDKEYIRHLVRLARANLGDEVIIFTTDPPGVIEKGTLPGDEVYSVVDFGPGWFNPSQYYEIQRRMNPPGKSPPFCSEFYTGWLSHWGEAMANTSTSLLVEDTKVLLEFANSTGSLSFYMIHGGTNFGFTAGANVDGNHYMPHITSYDYDAPISEAGDYGQPGIGGDNKYFALRDVIASHTGRKLPKVPRRPKFEAYGTVELQDSISLFDALPELYDKEGIRADAPDIMEEYGQRSGLILYRTHLPEGSLGDGGELDLGAPPHDYASVFVDGQLLGRLDRSTGDSILPLPARKAVTKGDKPLVLDVLVEAIGRQNFGCDTGGWDFKGLLSPEVKLNGNALASWRVFPLQLDSVSSIDYAAGSSATGAAGAVPSSSSKASVSDSSSASPSSSAVASSASASASASADPWGMAERSSATLMEMSGPASFATSRRLLGVGSGSALRFLGSDNAGTRASGGEGGDEFVPKFYRGVLSVGKEALLDGNGKRRRHPRNTYLDTRGWGKGIAWVNGFNLGWYWASQGPQMTLYVPGPVLREGKNEVVVLELEAEDFKAEASFVDKPDFWGPKGPQPSSFATTVFPPQAWRRVP